MLVPAEYKVDMHKATAEMTEALNAPMPGLTREDRWEDLEAEGWASLQQMPGS